MTTQNEKDNRRLAIEELEKVAKSFADKITTMEINTAMYQIRSEIMTRIQQLK